MDGAALSQRDHRARSEIQPRHTMTEGLFNPYEALGGATAVKAIVEDFYAYMDREPEMQTIRHLHPSDLSQSCEKLTLFLSGFLGGPPLYFERHGHPRLRMRHSRFPIGEAERDQWLQCMAWSLERHVTDAGLRRWLMHRLHQTADFMRNQEG